MLENDDGVGARLVLLLLKNDVHDCGGRRELLSEVICGADSGILGVVTAGSVWS